MTEPLWNPLFYIAQGDTVEISVHGCAIFHDRANIAKHSFSLIGRSLLNPWQFLATAFRPSKLEPFWAIGLSYHSGQNVHLAALEQLSAIANAGDCELFCPRHNPLDWEQAAQLKLAGKKPSRWHHPNSGKHLLILAACEKFGYPKQGYWSEDHPIQRQLFAILGGEAHGEIQPLSDNCGLPTFVMPSRILQNMWQAFAENDKAEAVDLKNLWLQNPFLVGGKGRLDSELTRFAKGRALVKEGTNGLLLVQSLPVGGEKAVSCLLKLASGYHYSHLAIALMLAIGKKDNLPSIFYDIKNYLESKLDICLSHGQTLIPA